MNCKKCTLIYSYLLKNNNIDLLTIEYKHFLIKKNIKILLLIFLNSSIANAQGFLACDIPLQNNKFHLENSINFEADNIFVGSGTDSITELVGNVRIVGADSITSSENATYNQSTES